MNRYIATALCALSLASVAPSTPIQAFNKSEKAVIALVAAAAIGIVLGNTVAQAEERDREVSLWRWWTFSCYREFLVDLTALIVWGEKADKHSHHLQRVAKNADWLAYLTRI